MFNSIQHIKTYQLKDLVGKNLRIVEFKSDEGSIIAAIDLNTRLIYVVEINCTSEIPEVGPTIVSVRSE